MKTCYKCKENKEYSEFYKNKNKKDGLCNECKCCAKEYHKTNIDKIKAHKKEYRKENAEKIKEYRKANLEQIKGYYKEYNKSLAGKLREYKGNAKSRNIPFNLTKNEFESFWQKPCEYCGDPIPTIGIDRIDSDIGYQVDNCIPCCTMCNLMKRHHSLEELQSHMLKFLRHQKIIP